MSDSDKEEKYKQRVKQHIDALVPIFAKASVGDFSQDAPLSQREDEFTSLEVGVQIMLDVIREKIKSYEDVNRQLQERYEEKNALLQSIVDGVVVLDKEGKITFLNRAAQDLSGWTEKEATGKKLVEIMPLERVDGTRVGWEHPTPTETYYCVRKNGTRFPVSATLAKVMLEGQDLGLIVVFRDVSREKELEELKEDFLSLATHQLRSPLVTMRWTLESVLEGVAGQVSDSIRKKLENVYQNNQHMIGLVNDILSVSRIGQGKMAEQKQAHDLTQLLGNLVTQMKPEAAHRGIKIITKINEGVRAHRYLVDASLLSHCIQNLVSNAIKYGKENSEVVITMTIDNNRICFVVADQGAGIPEADKAHLFEKFHRGQNVSQLDVPGSGLGLFVVKSIIEHWGGSITVASQENVGTTVIMCIPLEEA